MVCNFMGTLKAPDVEQPPEGRTLTNLRKKKSFTAPRRPAVSLEESVDVKLTRALAGVYANTDLACRFVAAEIRWMARA